MHYMYYSISKKLDKVTQKLTWLEASVKITLVVLVMGTNGVVSYWKGKSDETYNLHPQWNLIIFPLSIIKHWECFEI